MYKKIKNGSFMNWIWFIIATLPFILLLIYAIGFFNNEDLRANEQDNYTLTLNSISGSTLKTEENIFQSLTLYDGNVGTYNDNGSLTYTATNGFSPSYSTSILSTELYLWLFSDTTNTENYFEIRFHNSDLTYYDTQKYYFDNNNNYYGIGILALYNTLNVDNKTLTSFDINKQIDFNTNIYPIASRTNLYFNNNWFNNYKNYVNDFNTIKYNSCPISYSYNDNTYNIETNSNNYLGSNETLEINQDFNYTLNEQPTLNYNNYFISNITSETFLGTNVGNNIQLENNYNFSKVYENNTFIYEYNPNYTYYIKNPSLNLYRIKEIADQTQYNQLKNILYIANYTNIEYEYYNIESTINTSIELIPNNNFNDFLTNVNNTIQTNGFISNAFLNLATLFGVNNIYYSLACYYIEYLLIIILLHLAFDLLYIVPNICHKFMEKIGGERD